MTPRSPDDSRPTTPAEVPAVRTLGLTKRFGPVTAVDGVDLTLEVGKVYGLLGRNGAGKTTIMALLTGQIFPTAGSVEVFGPHRRRTRTSWAGCASSQRRRSTPSPSGQLTYSARRPGSSSTGTLTSPVSWSTASGCPSTGRSRRCRAASSPRSASSWAWPPGRRSPSSTSRTWALGGLLSVTVAGHLDAAERVQSAELGLRLGPVSLQELVVNLVGGSGERPPAPTEASA